MKQKIQAPSEGRPSKVRRFFTSSAFYKTLAVLLALFVWQIVAMIISEQLILVSPWRVLLRLTTIWREDGFFTRILLTTVRIVGGFLIAFVFGTGLAALAARFRFVETLLYPYIAVLRAVPVVTFIVLAYAGISYVGMTSGTISTLIAFLIVLPTVYTNLLAGFKARDEKLEEMAKVFGIRPWRKLLFVRLPALAPHITSAVALGAGLAFKSGIAAELMSGVTDSVGGAMYYASLWLQNVDLYAWTVILLLVSVGFEKLTVGLLRLGFRRLWRI